MYGETAARPTLQTQRLLLRPFSLEDAVETQHLANDYEIASMTRTVHYPYELAHAQEWIGRHEELWRTGKAVIWAVCWNETGAIAGAVGLEICDINHLAELGYWVGADWRGKGIATEAARRAIQFGFEDLGLNRIFAHHMTRNPASGRILEKVGMTKEGLLRKQARKWGEYFDVAVFGILAEERELLENSTNPSNNFPLRTN